MKDIIALTICFCILVIHTSSKDQDQQHSTEIITIGGNIISIQFNIISHQLPFFIQKALKDNNVEEVEVKMGFKKHKRISYRLPDNGIKSYIKSTLNNHLPSERFFLLISSLFSISINQEFRIQIGEGLSFLSDPNDKFCSQNVDSIIGILPCGDKSGFSQLINTQILFTGSYVGLKILWTHSSMKITFLIEINNKNKNIVRSHIKRKCFAFQQSLVYNQVGLLLDKPLITDELKIQGKQTKLVEYRPEFRQIKGQWYSYGKTKQLLHTFNYTKHLLQQSKIVSITFRQLFPKGYKVISVDIKNKKNGTFMYELVKLKSKATLVIANLSDYEIEEGIYKLQIQYKKYMLGFEQYQLIGAGGEQFMTVPIVLRSNREEYFYLESSSVSDKLIQPDFSIPFHVITFTIAILGYIWIALWKIFFRFLSISEKQPKQQNVKAQ